MRKNCEQIVYSDGKNWWKIANFTHVICLLKSPVGNTGEICATLPLIFHKHFLHFKQLIKDNFYTLSTSPTITTIYFLLKNYNNRI